MAGGARLQLDSGVHATIFGSGRAESEAYARAGAGVQLGRAFVGADAALYQDASGYLPSGRRIERGLALGASGTVRAAHWLDLTVHPVLQLSRYPRPATTPDPTMAGTWMPITRRETFELHLAASFYW